MFALIIYFPLVSFVPFIAPNLGDATAKKCYIYPGCSLHKIG